MFQIGDNAPGFTGHPGVKLAMAEDRVMELEDRPSDPAAVLKTASEDALVRIMTGVVRVTGLMQEA